MTRDEGRDESTPCVPMAQYPHRRLQAQANTHTDFLLHRGMGMAEGNRIAVEFFAMTEGAFIVLASAPRYSFSLDWTTPPENMFFALNDKNKTRVRPRIVFRK